MSRKIAPIPWADADHRDHPDEPHYCRCRTHVDPDCVEHGWMYDETPAAPEDGAS